MTPPNRGWCGTSLVCTRSMTSFHCAPSCVLNSAVPFTESRVGPLSHAVKRNEPEIGATLFEYGPFFTCDSSPSRSSPNARRIGAALSGNGNGPGRIWITGPPPVTPIACTLSAGDPFLRSEEHTSELQSPCNLVCRLLLEKKNNSNVNCNR